MDKEYIDINSIREKEFQFYELENFITFEEREKYRIICSENIKNCENYIISNIIRAIRKKLSLTQKQLGELIGKKEITIRKYESGTININENILYLVMKSLKIENLYFIKSELNFLEDPNIYDLIDNFYNDILRLKSFENISDIGESYIKGEISKKVLKVIEIFFNNDNIQDSFYLLFSEYSKKFQFLSDEEKKELSYDLKNYLDFLNFKYQIK